MSAYRNTEKRKPPEDATLSGGLLLNFGRVNPPTCISICGIILTVAGSFTAAGGSVLPNTSRCKGGDVNDDRRIYLNSENLSFVPDNRVHDRFTNKKMTALRPKVAVIF